MKKIIYFILILLLFGCSTTDNLLVKKICNNELEYLSGYQGGEVFKCGDYYTKNPPNSIVDAPRIIIDNEGNHVAYCGGMPLAVPRDIPEECYIECEPTNLC